jgi:hypothetical protein
VAEDRSKQGLQTGANMRDEHTRSPESRASMSALVHDLATQIEREHRAALNAAACAIQHAIERGRLLLQAKATLAHCSWLPWVDANLSFGDRQARKYMRLALRCDRIGIGNADAIWQYRQHFGAVPRDVALRSSRRKTGIPGPLT